MYCRVVYKKKYKSQESIDLFKYKNFFRHQFTRKLCAFENNNSKSLKKIMNNTEKYLS